MLKIVGISCIWFASGSIVAAFSAANLPLLAAWLFVAGLGSYLACAASNKRLFL